MYEITETISLTVLFLSLFFSLRGTFRLSLSLSVHPLLAVRPLPPRNLYCSPVTGEVVEFRIFFRACSDDARRGRRGM